MSSLPSRIKAIWNTYGIEIAKFCTVGGAAFVVNSVVVWTLMVTIMHDSHTKAKVIASIVATIFSWLMNRLWTFRENRSENWKREAIEFAFVNILGILVEAGCVAFSTYILGLRTAQASFISGISSTGSGCTANTANRLLRVGLPSMKSLAICWKKQPRL